MTLEDTVISEQPDKQVIDARLYASKLRELYKNDPLQKKFNALVIGEKGTGKTRLLRTARKPVHVDSFDPGGTQVLDDLIVKGDIIADTRYENEDPSDPKVFSDWCRNFRMGVASKYFDSIGTYCLDSVTQWSEAIMYWVQKQAELADKSGKTKLLGNAPRAFHDYVPQKVQINIWLRRMLNLPCDVIVTGHIYGVYETRTRIDGTTEERLTGWRFMSTGKGTVTIPLVFSEMWVTSNRTTSKGPDFELITGRDGLYLGSTRIGKEGKFAIREKADIKALLSKAGMDTKDKPKLL